jgi:hypothetical protein
MTRTVVVTYGGRTHNLQIRAIPKFSEMRLIHNLGEELCRGSDGMFEK